MTNKTKKFSIDSLIKAMEMCSSQETPEYLVKQAMEIIERLNIPSENKESSIANLVEFSKISKLKFSDIADVWAGKFRAANPYKNLHDALAKEAAEQLVGKEIVFYFAINDTSDFTRGATIDGQEADQSAYAILDNFVNAFLVSFNMKNTDGILYDTDEKGDTLNPVDPELTKAIILSPTAGLEAFGNKYEVQISVRLTKYS